MTAAQANALVKLMKNKWIKLSKADEGFKEMIQMTARDDFFRLILVPSGKLTKTAPKAVDGVVSIRLDDGQGTL